MKCLSCKSNCDDDYYTIDAKRIYRQGLATVPTYVLCPECYDKLIEALEELNFND